VRRDAIRLGVKGRTKSEAQALALSTGRHKHPTRGKKRPDDVRVKISESVSDDWENMPPEEREAKRQEGRERWAKMSDVDKAEFLAKAGDGIRKAAKQGSKLEKFLFDELLQEGYQVSFHQTRFIKNENLHLDLLLPILKVAIEVDGPSHFLPIWGEDALEKNKRADADKDGLLLGSGYCVIRIQQRKSLSEKYKRDLLKKLLKTLGSIAKKFPNREDRHITIGAKHGAKK